MSMSYEAELHSQAGALDGVEAFLSVAQRRNFPKAAAALGITPSAVSQAVRALEARIGAAPHNAQCRSDRGRRTVHFAREARLRGTGEAARELGQRTAGLLRLSVPRAAVRSC
jgi:DNA-binding transcriptional LysR family regulator